MNDVAIGDRQGVAQGHGSTLGSAESGVEQKGVEGDFQADLKEESVDYIVYCGIEGISSVFLRVYANVFEVKEWEGGFIPMWIL